MNASLRSLLGRALLAGLLVSSAPLVVLAPCDAAAQQEEARILFERANQHLARGLRARGRGRERELAEAIEAYFGVLRLGARTRNVVFNLALALAELQRNQEAFNFYSEYLRAFDLSDDERAEGQRRLDAIRPHVAVIHVESAPPGAEVRVGRRDLPVRGTTPLDLAVPAGSHPLFLTRAGFVESTASATAIDGATARVAIQLTPQPIDVQVIAPSIGRLTLDGEAIEAGRTTRVAPGPHVVRLEVANAPPIERRFEVAAGDAPLVLELSAPSGAALSRIVMTIDARADVYVDNLRVGHGDELEIPVAAGPHELRVAAPGRSVLVHRVSLDAEETLRLGVDLGVVPDATGVHAARAVLGALTLVGLGTSIGLGVNALDLSGQWNAAIAAQRGERTMSAAQLHALADRVESAALMTDVAIGITAALFLGTLISFFVDPGSPQESSVRVGAAPAPGGGVVTAELAWGAP